MPNGHALSLVEARELTGAMVYALEDAASVFYVGRTRNAAKRFYQHGKAESTNLYLARRLRLSKGSVHVRLLAGHLIRRD